MMVSASSRSSPLLLYVDDERQNRTVFKRALPPDVNVRIANDGPSAIAIMEAEEVAVLVTDMRMPLMTGEELLRIAKARWPLTIRMVVTAYSDIDPILHAINEGLVARYIVKPWNEDELLQTLRWATEAWLLGRDSAAVHRRLLETERLATLGSLSGMIVHDLKQPLMSLLVNAEILRELAEHAPLLRRGLEHVESPDKEYIAETLESLPQLTDDVRTALGHMGDLISGLRGFSKQRPHAKQLATDPMPILKQAISACQEIESRVRVEIEYVGPAQLPRLRMQSTELTQVLINLVANAAQAVAASGKPAGKVVVDARDEATGLLAVTIRDNGVGMSPEVLQRVGTPFFTTREEGTGLGVANCQRLVGAAGGRMRVESELGAGTTVTIQLPVAAPDPAG